MKGMIKTGASVTASSGVGTIQPMKKPSEEATCVRSEEVSVTISPLHDIVITNIVWCMAYTGWVGGRSYIAQKSG